MNAASNPDNEKAKTAKEPKKKAPKGGGDGGGASTKPGATTHRFEAEVSQVLKLVIHSLYSNKEIFLRELLSNASDALDRLRFRSITEPQLLGEDRTLEIRLRFEKEKGALVIEDTGVGMTEEELIQNLGTVAHSGTRTFLEKLGDKKGDLNVIGQFGVGFYSAYLVADRVEVVTRAAGPDHKALLWRSNAEDTFTIEPAERTQRGTEVWLYLREDQKDYLESQWKLRASVEKYSDYVGYPIKLEIHNKKKNDAGVEVDEISWDQINKASALWQRPKSEITDEQYNEFYKHLTRDFEPPLSKTHFRVEGTQEFVALLYLPKRKPFDLNDPRKRRGVRLFVKRVFIMDDCEEMLVPYLRFVRGVVDSNDLPLNVSRELLQDSSILKTIRKNISKKVFDALDDLAKEKPEEYKQFFKDFGATLKEGLAQGTEDKDKERILELVRYETTKGEGPVALADYVARMPEKQEAIYYMTALSKETAETAPYLESLKKKGYEILLMTDPIDEWASQGLDEYKGKKFVSAMRADLKFEATEDEKKENERLSTSMKPLVERMKKVLEKNVKDVKVSERLTDSPCCLVLGEYSPSPFMERLMREHGKDGFPPEKRTLEINPQHPLIEGMNALLEKNAEDPAVVEWIETLYDQAIITEGGTLADPNRFAKRVAAMLTKIATSGTA